MGPKGKEGAVFLRKFLSQQLLTTVLFHVIFLFLLMTAADRGKCPRTKDLAGEAGVTPETNKFAVIFYHFLEETINFSPRFFSPENCRTCISFSILLQAMLLKINFQ